MQIIYVFVLFFFFSFIRQRMLKRVKLFHLLFLGRRDEHRLWVKTAKRQWRLFFRQSPNLLWKISEKCDLRVGSSRTKSRYVFTFLSSNLQCRWSSYLVHSDEMSHATTCGFEINRYFFIKTTNHEIQVFLYIFQTFDVKYDEYHKRQVKQFFSYVHRVFIL